MKLKLKQILIVFSCLSLLSCAHLMIKNTSSLKKECNSLNDNKVIYSIAKSIIEKGNNNKIWSIIEIDTSELLIIEDYFTNSKTKSKLILFGGSVGSSTDSADNLLLLINCFDTPEIIWSEQVLPFYKDAIIDLNKDNIKEIIISFESIKAGESKGVYSIFNFKNGKKNILYEKQSKSFIDFTDNLNQKFNKGDTLENSFQVTLIKDNDSYYKIRQVHTIKIQNGGITSDEQIKQLKIYRDTTYFNL